MASETPKAAAKPPVIDLRLTERDQAAVIPPTGPGRPVLIVVLNDEPIGAFSDPGMGARFSQALGLRQSLARLLVALTNVRNAPPGEDVRASEELQAAVKFAVDVLAGGQQLEQQVVAAADSARIIRSIQ